MRLFLAAAILLVATTARADAPVRSSGPAPDVKQMHTDDCARARAQNKACVLDMGNDIVEGNNPTATGSIINIIEGGKASSLIKLRRDFIEEILKSAEDVD